MTSILLRNTYSLYLLQIANYIIPFVTLPFLVYQLGHEAFGWLAWCSALNFYFVLFVDAGMNSYASKELAKLDPRNNHESRAAAGLLVYQVTALKFILMFTSAFLMLILLYFIDSWFDQWRVFALCFMTVIGSTIFPTWLFQGLQIMDKTLLFGLIGRLVATFGIFIFVDGPNDLLWAALFQSSATFISGIIAMPTIFTLSLISFRLPSWSGIYEIALKSRHTAITEFSLTALANSTVFLIGLVVSKEMAGIYSAIEKTVRAAASLFVPLLQAAQPRWVQSWHRSEYITQPINLQRWSFVFLSLGIFGGVLTFISSEWVLNILFGEGISKYSYLLKIFSFWLPFFVFNSMMCSWWWIASGRERLLAKRTLPCVFLQAISFSYIILNYNIEYALWGWVLCESIMSLLLIYKSGFLSQKV